MQKHLFVLDPLDSLNRDLDSSLKLAYELVRRGHRVYGTEPWQIYWDSQQRVPSVRAYALAFEQSPSSASKGELAELSLKDFAGIHMRKDPPFDLDYITTTWLLETVSKEVKVFNDPAGLRAVNEKLAILAFPEFASASLVSSDPQQLVDYIASECAGDAVVKPLTLYGGKGIERIQIGHADTHKAALSKLKALTENGVSLRLCQAFNPSIYEGEVRAFTVGGEALAWCLKKPSAGQFMANSNFGSTRHKYTPSVKEVHAVTTIAKRLYADHAISLVGFDLIGGKVSEVNVTSPRLLQALDDKRNYYEDLAAWIIKVCA